MIRLKPCYETNIFSKEDYLSLKIRNYDCMIKNCIKGLFIKFKFWLFFREFFLPVDRNKGISFRICTITNVGECISIAYRWQVPLSINIIFTWRWCDIDCYSCGSTLCNVLYDEVDAADAGFVASSNWWPGDGDVRTRWGVGGRCSRLYDDYGRPIDAN